MKHQRVLPIGLAAALALMPVTSLAQGPPPLPAAATAARAAQQLPALPTGPLSATTKAAAAVRASRAAQVTAAKSGAVAGASAKSTSVMGYLWTANNTAIPDASVQLRNTVTGQVELLTKTNAAGEFAFNNVNGGSYVIEFASDSSSKVLAFGHPFTVAPGETVATFVRMSNVVTAVVPDLASNVVQSAMQSAASAGVTAVVTPIAPVEVAPPPPASSVK